jgi:hypothetical protein
VFRGERQAISLGQELSEASALGHGHGAPEARQPHIGAAWIRAGGGGSLFQYPLGEKVPDSAKQIGRVDAHSRALPRLDLVDDTGSVARSVQQGQENTEIQRMERKVRYLVAAVGHRAFPIKCPLNTVTLTLLGRPHNPDWSRSSELRLFALPGTLSAQDADEDAEARSEVALAWIDLLKTGDYEAAAAHVSEDERVASQMGSPEQLESIWTQLGAQLGELGSLERKTEAMANGLHVVIMTGVFTNGTFDVQVVVDDERKVMGFFVRPPS